MFLENNRCSIHKAKPLVCRPFPFEYSIIQGGEVEFSINEEASSFCRGLGKGSRLFDFTESEKFALSMESQNEAFRKRVQQWNATAFSRKIKSSEKEDVINFLITDINQ
jgi:Fe-S-cluster containining protein